MPHPHVLLYEKDPDIVELLLDLFSQEQITTTICQSSEDLDDGLTRHPTAIVVTNTWDAASPTELSAAEREGISSLASTTWVIVTSTRPCAEELAQLPGSERIAFLSKPYDLTDLLVAVNAAAQAQTRAQGPADGARTVGPPSSSD